MSGQQPYSSSAPLTWRSLIQHYCQQNDDEKNLLAIIDALTGESTSAFKLLLPDTSQAHVLYIGNNKDETLHNLAKNCKQLTALSLFDNNAALLIAKNKIRQPAKNIGIVIATGQNNLPFSDHCFDGIILNKTIENAALNNGHPLQNTLMSEINRTLKPNGWVFQKSENRLNRLHLSAYYRKLKANLLSKSPNNTVPEARPANTNIIRPTYPRSIRGYKKLLMEQGLTPQACVGFDNTQSTVDSIIDLSSTPQINHFIRSNGGSLSHFPTWLYRSTVPVVGILATKAGPLPSIIEEVIAETADHMTVDLKDMNIRSIETNRKCKFIVTVEVGAPTNQTVVIKIPIDEIANTHLAHNYQGLKKIYSSLEKNTLNQQADIPFPMPVTSGSFKNTCYFVERYLPGKPWRTNPKECSQEIIIQQVTNILKLTRSLTLNEEKNTESINHRVSYIRNLVAEYSEQLAEIFDSLTKTMTAQESADNTKTYFYKSDFSVSNIMISGNKASGIIDLDFWGSSHNKLVDYADFILSFSRNFYSLSYIEVLSALYSGNMSKLPDVLKIEENLHALEGDIIELKNAALIAWINSVHHALEFKRAQFNQHQVNRLLFNPLRELSKAL